MQPRKLHSGPINHVSACRNGLFTYNQRDSWIGRSLDQYGEYCPGESRLFKQLVRPGMTVVEVGANIGVHTVQLAGLVGESGSVLAFEPQAVVFQLLCANVALNSILHVRCYQKGVGQKPGSLLVPPLDYRQAANFGNVSLQPASPGERGERVDAVSLDSLQLPRCDFIKIDVEGMEWEVLQGAEGTIKQHHPTLYLECDQVEQSAQITNWLGQLGYRMYWFIPPYFEPQNYYENPANVLGAFANTCLLAVHGDEQQIEGLEQAFPGDAQPRSRQSREAKVKTQSHEAPALSDDERQRVLMGLPLGRDPNPAELRTLSVKRPDPKACVILVPVAGSIQPDCESALQVLERQGYAVWRVRGYSAIDQGRNQLATDALGQGFAETFWIDDDVAFDPTDVDRIRCFNLPLCAGVYPKKGKRELALHVLPGTAKLVFGKKGCVTEVKYTATGFLHVRREVYESIQQRLELPTCNAGFGSPMIPFFHPMIVDTDKGPWYLAEDYSFCERARRCGFQIMVDTRVRLWHVGTYKYSWEDAGIDRERFGDFTLNLT